jgi:hypothetical protein
MYCNITGAVSAARHTEQHSALLDASKEAGLKVNPEKTNYMLVSRCKKAGPEHSIKTANRSFEGAAKIKYV